MSKVRIELLHDNTAEYLCGASVKNMLSVKGQKIISTLPKRGYHMSVITWTKYSRTRRKVAKLYVRGYKAERLEYKSNRLLKAVMGAKE